MLATLKCERFQSLTLRILKAIGSIANQCGYNFIEITSSLSVLIPIALSSLSTELLSVTLSATFCQTFEKLLIIVEKYENVQNSYYLKEIKTSSIISKWRTKGSPYLCFLINLKKLTIQLTCTWLINYLINLLNDQSYIHKDNYSINRIYFKN